MVSDFLVEHPSGPFFQLYEKEWMNAVKKLLELLDGTDLHDEKYSTTVAARLGVDLHFDNNVIFITI